MSSVYIHWMLKQYSSLKYISHYVLLVAVATAIIITTVLYPMNFSAAERAQSVVTFVQNKTLKIEELNKTNTVPSAGFPKIEKVDPKRVYYVSTTAYNSEPGQTDDTPCITANGFNVCDHGVENIVATNMLPFGTQVTFPELHGDKVFIVMDRMNARYTTRVDFWMLEKSDARQFGLKHNVKMEVL